MVAQSTVKQADTAKQADSKQADTAIMQADTAKQATRD